MVEQLVAHPAMELFRTPVLLDTAPQYTSIVTKPMDLGTIVTRLEQNEYRALVDVYDDLELGPPRPLCLAFATPTTTASVNSEPEGNTDMHARRSVPQL
jgi:hypothetical protein